MENKNVSGFTVLSFFNGQLLSGILILFSSITALILANSAIASVYFNFIHTNITFHIGSIEISKVVKEWVNDGLMTFFFLLIGFEIKRELIAGELSAPKKVIFPMIAAIGGMLLPILIFLVFNYNQPALKGWGIPMSTDIAFTLSIMLILGRNISKPLKVAVTALAIIDDIGALLVIAAFYSAGISSVYLLASALLVVLISVYNRFHRFHGLVYFLTGIALWVLFSLSGVHPVIAGVILAFVIPSNTKINFSELKDAVSNQIEKIDQTFINRDRHFEYADHSSKKAFENLSSILKKVEPPLQRYERGLKPYVNFLLVPFFAFVNSGIDFSNIQTIDLISPLALGIILGLMLGKSSGIFLFSFLSSRFKAAELPAETTLKNLYGVSWLAGIGFTMSIFIAELSFQDEHYLNVAKISIFIGSVLSALIGSIVISFFNPAAKKKLAN